MSQIYFFIKTISIVIITTALFLSMMVLIKSVVQGFYIFKISHSFASSK